MTQFPLTPTEKKALKAAEAILERERISRADRRHTAPGARGQECSAPAMRHHSLEPLALLVDYAKELPPTQAVVYSESRGEILVRRR